MLLVNVLFLKLCVSTRAHVYLCLTYFTGFFVRKIKIQMVLIPLLPLYVKERTSESPQGTWNSPEPADGTQCLE